MKEYRDKLLKEIANNLILHSLELNDVGLFYGKMGIVIFFEHYFRYTGEVIYDDFAGDLLDDICDKIPKTLPINMENGLCGIGWGIEYLIQNNFMKGDADYILDEIDEKILEMDLEMIHDYTIESGLIGILLYISFRMSNKYYSNYKQKVKRFLPMLNFIVNTNFIEYVVRLNNVLNMNDFSLFKGCAGFGIRFLI